MPSQLCPWMPSRRQRLSLHLLQRSRWVQHVIDIGGEHLEVNDLWAQLGKKVAAGESNYGGSKRGGAERPVCKSHLKEIIFALRKSFNQLLPKAVDDGYFQKYSAYKSVAKQMEATVSQRKHDAGDEAVQRRDKCFTDQEQACPLPY